VDELGQYAEAMECLLKSKAIVRQNNMVNALEHTYDKLIASGARCWRS